MRQTFKIYNYDDIQVVHLEITDKCNASCPQCLRNMNSRGVNPYLSLTELSLDDIKLIFNIKFISQLKRMYMCGNYGDPIVARDCLEVFKYFRRHNPEMTLGMNTNGSLKSLKWWKELARLMGENGYVRFGIDGLKDTHHLYRQGTDWHRIIKNAQAFISAGGKAIWDYIIFAHNEHQVDKAKELSKSLGFAKFIPKKTWRFYSSFKNKGRKYHLAMNRQGEEIVLARPKNLKYLNEALKKENEIKKKYGTMGKYLNEVKINCKSVQEKNVYLSAEGLVFPCCWLAIQLYIWYLPKQGAQIWKYIEELGGLDQLNAKKRPLAEIVNGNFFQEFLPWSWQQSSIKRGKLKVCAQMCGVEFDPFGAQYK